MCGIRARRKKYPTQIRLSFLQAFRFTIQRSLIKTNYMPVVPFIFEANNASLECTHRKKIKTGPMIGDPEGKKKKKELLKDRERDKISECVKRLFAIRFQRGVDSRIREWHTKELNGGCLSGPN
ncbi:hypothetical protein TNIN_492231 [Trichonephila inaurata madagascariensis]|uniref:Uncharacterized protein n=1 Tax=Trichonephila inaurata madagascariensis TaxID=2747483 RepID=A0A8X6MLG3_9ARAC|nr:hypothetical protein TNIN_492231 [Trichonephila inaurata madagascariensis]